MRWIIAVILAGHCSAFAQLPSKMGQLSHKARALLEAGKCEQVLALKDQLGDLENVDDLDALARYEVTAARCHFDKKDLKGTEERFRTILFIKPDFEIDAFETPPALVALFQRIKTELAEKSKELDIVKEAEKKKTQVLETRVVMRKMSPLTPLIPFGLAQFEYGSQTKGILIAALEGAFAIANIGSYWAKRSFLSAEASNLVTDQSALSSYNLAQGLQFASLGLFAAVYIFGAIDGFIHKDDLSFESSQTQSRKLNQDEFLRRLEELKNKGS